ncbi:hypothetical protein MRX96_017284 [Rhipicephalus microplus]
MGDQSERPKLIPHSDGPQPRRHLFHGLPQHPLPGFDGLRPLAVLLRPAAIHHTVVARFTSLPRWMVKAIFNEVAPKPGAPWPPGVSPHVTKNGNPPLLPEMQVVKRRGSHSPVEQGTEAVRSKGTRARPHVGPTTSRSETSRKSPSKEDQQEHIERFLSRLLRAVADFGLGVPAEKEELRCSARKFIYSAATLRSLNVHTRVSTPASRTQDWDENPEGSARSTRSVRYNQPR